MMSKTVKKWLIAAAVLILVGAAMFTIALVLCGWDITKLGTVDYVTTTLEPSGDFENITINVFTTDLKLLPSEDGKCRIICYEDEKVSHTAEVKDGTLVIGTEDSRIWLDFISISFTGPTMTVYLPQNEYEFLDIRTDTGAVSVSNVYAGSINLKTDTGTIKLSGGTIAENIDVKTGTGFVSLENISCGDLHAKADTGGVRLNSVTCSDLHAETDTGNIALENVIGTGKFELISDTGHIGFNGCDAAELYIETDTGSVIGELLTDKIFFANSDTGHVSVPKSMTGGRCEINTDTGYIEVRVKE